jgi:hypothetical protein
MTSKKFLIGMAALLSVPLFFIGWPTETEEKTVTNTVEVPDDGVFYPVRVQTEGELRAVLASGLSGAIGFRSSDGASTAFADGEVVLDVGGLDIGGTVYLEHGGKLV